MVYGRPPPCLLSYCPGSSNTDAVDLALQSRDELLASLRQNLLRAQQKMKTTYDAHHRDVQFQEGDKVLLQLQPYRQLSLATRRHQKLLPKFYGPFTSASLMVLRASRDSVKLNGHDQLLGAHDDLMLSVPSVVSFTILLVICFPWL